MKSAPNNQQVMRATVSRVLAMIALSGLLACVHSEDETFFQGEAVEACGGRDAGPGKAWGRGASMDIAQDEAKRALLSDHRVPKAVQSLVATKITVQCQQKDGTFRVEASFDVAAIKDQVARQQSSLSALSKGCGSPRGFLPFATLRHQLVQTTDALNTASIPGLALEPSAALPRCSSGPMVLDMDEDTETLVAAAMKGVLSDAGAAFASDAVPGAPTLRFATKATTEAPAGGGSVYRGHLEVHAEVLDATGHSVATGAVVLIGVGTSEAEARRDANRLFASSGLDQLLDGMVKGGGN